MRSASGIVVPLAVKTVYKITGLSKCAQVLLCLVGDIDVVMGGPPCQGVSGLNRHSAVENILKDGRCAVHFIFMLFSFKSNREMLFLLSLYRKRAMHAASLFGMIAEHTLISLLEL